MTVADCTDPACRNGVVSTYWGELVHPMYGSLKIDGEHDHPATDSPGGRFYGGSSHQACAHCFAAKPNPQQEVNP